ncbi:GerAB/ArcD/ProY family transporter [Paenibacillus arenilitoris]|uniref:Endospore germination permease n=1 Tax=Paenibacillus arenilitoris TaxID=2772299 RepID=A0A927CM05_9BACL|nr:endospore germination permease [Paenibacillus arenilitoris]MBD2870024.1 endospore germination permease [Paenibacillus arenilitoris]
MEQTSLSPFQMFCVVTCFVVGTTFIMLPNATIADAKQFGWLVHVWGVVFGLLVGMLWIYISGKHPGLTLVQILNRVFGKYAGGAISVCYIVFFIQIAAWVTRNISDYMHVTMMPRTPPTVFHLMTLGVCAYAAVKGIRSISLVSLFVVPYISVSFWLPYTVMLNEWEWRNFHIPNDFHFWPVLAETRYALGFPFLETVACMMIFPMVRSKLKASVLGGTAFGGIQIALSIFFAIGILGVYRSSHLLYPKYTIFREMEFSSFFEHLESIISINVLLVVFVKLSVIYYFAVTAICQVFSVQNRALVAVPLLGIISAYSLLFSNIAENAVWIHDYLFIYYVPFGIGFPVLILLFTWLRKGRGERAS